MVAPQLILPRSDDFGNERDGDELSYFYFDAPLFQPRKVRKAIFVLDERKKSKEERVFKVVFLLTQKRTSFPWIHLLL